jgi:hypothetical protein
VLAWAELASLVSAQAGPGGAGLGRLETELADCVACQQHASRNRGIVRRWLRRLLTTCAHESIHSCADCAQYARRPRGSSAPTTPCLRAFPSAWHGAGADTSERLRLPREPRPLVAPPPSPRRRSRPRAKVRVNTDRARLGRRQRGKFGPAQHAGRASVDTSEASSAQTSVDGARLSGHP